MLNNCLASMNIHRYLYMYQLIKLLKKFLKSQEKYFNSLPRSSATVYISNYNKKQNII